MAKLEKKTKAELIMMCYERGSEIECLRKEVAKIQEQFDITDKALVEEKKRFNSLEQDFDGIGRKHDEEIKSLHIKYSEELQALRNKVSERDKTITMQGESYQNLKKDFDNLIHENGLNKANAAKYKLATVVALIAFIVALILGLLLA